METRTGLDSQQRKAGLGAFAVGTVLQAAFRLASGWLALTTILCAMAAFGYATWRLSSKLQDPLGTAFPKDDISRYALPLSAVGVAAGIYRLVLFVT
jgi:hypothetical protein